MINPERLKETEIFQDLTFDELTKVAAICTPEDFRQGDTVILSEEPAERFYILEKGSVSITFPNGSEIQLDQAGSLAGWSSLVSPYRYLGTMRCLSDCRFLVFPSQEFLEIITTAAAIGCKVMQRISSVLSHRLQHIAKGE